MGVRGRIVAIEGASGAGKSTLVRTGASEFGWVALPEAFDRLDPHPPLTYRTTGELRRIERTLLAEEMRRFRDAERSRRQGRTVVADTGFLGPITYTAGLETLGIAPTTLRPELARLLRASARPAAWGVPDLIVFLEVGERTRRARARRDAERHPPGLDRRHARVSAFERRFYRTFLRKVPGVRIRFVRARSSPRALARRLDAVIRALPDRPPIPPPRLPDLLRHLDREVARFAERGRRRTPATVKNRTRPRTPPR